MPPRSAPFVICFCMMMMSGLAVRSSPTDSAQNEKVATLSLLKDTARTGLSLDARAAFNRRTLAATGPCLQTTAASLALQKAGLVLGDAEWLTPVVGGVSGRRSIVAILTEIFWPTNVTASARACFGKSVEAYATYFVTTYSPQDIVDKANLTARADAVNLELRTVLPLLQQFHQAQTSPLTKADLYINITAGLTTLFQEVFDPTLPAGSALPYKMIVGSLYISWLQDNVYRYALQHSNATDPDPAATYRVLQQAIRSADLLVNISATAIVDSVLQKNTMTNTTCEYLPGARGSDVSIGNCNLLSTSPGFAFDFDIPFQNCRPKAATCEATLRKCLNTSPCGKRCWRHGGKGGGHLFFTQANATFQAYKRSFHDYLYSWRLVTYTMLSNPSVAWKAFDQGTNLAVAHAYTERTYFVGGSGTTPFKSVNLLPAQQAVGAKPEYGLKAVYLWGGHQIVHGIQLVWSDVNGTVSKSPVAGSAQGKRAALNLDLFEFNWDTLTTEQVTSIRGQLSWKYHNYLEVRTSRGRSISAGSLVPNTNDFSVYDYNWNASSELMRLKGFTVETGTHARDSVLNLNIVMTLGLWKTELRKFPVYP